jgi:hypothetical protein
MQAQFSILVCRVAVDFAVFTIRSDRNGRGQTHCSVLRRYQRFDEE